jgi:hypothetical protein
MTPVELAAIEERLQKATPGPWCWEAEDAGSLLLGTCDGRNGVDLRATVLSASRCKECQKREEALCMWPNEVNGALIAHAPGDLRRLLDYVRELEARQ